MQHINEILAKWSLLDKQQVFVNDIPSKLHKDYVDIGRIIG